ncbi:hypothetical protein BKK82_14895 [Bacillus velezensis]|nr:hypothetical protein [Bacillus velezensis]MEC1107807.1 hypothetical protein [Bacillus velezensis]OQC78204.1 hypothetical protein BKK82_14895 [Bacillus velezensis]
MKDLDYGKGYKYAHDTEEKLTTMHTMPDSLIGREQLKVQKLSSNKDLRKSRIGIKETANLSLNEYVLYIKIMRYGVN